MGNFLEKIGIARKELPLTAEKCCYEARHGYGSFKTKEERILDKQDSITRIINSKVGFETQQTSAYLFADYHCVVDIDDDLQDKESIEAIFQPFIDSGFEILNLSEAIKGIISTKGLYLISWERAFDSCEKVVKL
jgi:hypothetical protein